MKVGDKIRVTKVEIVDAGCFAVGDTGIITGINTGIITGINNDGVGYWVDFSGNEVVHDDGMWFVFEDQCELVE